MKRRWSPDELDAVRRRYADTPTAQIAEALGRTASQVYQCAVRLGLSKSAAYLAGPHACRLRRGDNVGAAHRFKKGQTPPNKGLRRPGWGPGRMKQTQFKCGQMSGAAQRNYRPIGSERLSKDGYLERKVTDDPPVPARRWVGVHRIVWEEVNGPVPDGHAVVFRPGRRTTDKARITIDGLELVTRAELMRRNTCHRYPKEIAQVIQLRGAIQRQINKRTRREEQDHRPA